MKEKIKDKEDLIDTVYDQIMHDIKIGYGEAIEELITFLPVVNLIEYLPEERWEEFKHLREELQTIKN
jgi:radical SAM superfamily enzyme with C-terminal helix-hairpin-helix motif